MQDVRSDYARSVKKPVLDYALLSDAERRGSRCSGRRGSSPRAGAGARARP